MSISHIKPEKESYCIVKFSYESEVQRFVNISTAPIPGDIALPAMEITLPPNSGTFEKSEATVLMPITSNTSYLLEPLSRGTPFPPVSVEITEVSRSLISGDTPSTLIPFRGVVIRTHRNPNNQKNRVLIYLGSVKDRLEIPTGLPCNHKYNWTLYLPMCGRVGSYGPQKNTEKKTVTLVDINCREITISGTYALTPADKSYRFGYVEYGETRVGIRDWDRATKMQLTRQLPVEWLNETITLVPGCDKSVEHCRAAWDNEDQFGGIGFSIPAYNPIIEQPQG